MTTLPERTRPEGCITDLRFDAFFADELSAEARTALETHLASCTRCQTRHETLRVARTGYLDQAPRFTPPVAKPKRVPRWAPVAAALALAASVLLAVRPNEPAGHDTRPKGSERLGFFVKHGESVRRGTSGETVAPGDSLRFSYSAGTARHLVILSLDGAAHASVYFPAGAESMLVPARSDATLEQAVELDDTLGTERILGLFCKDGHAVEPLRADLERQASGFRAPEDCSTVELTIVKRAAP